MPLSRLTPLNLPPLVAPRLEEGADGVMRIWDPLRQRFTALTPEEWVRQHFTAWMTTALGYPPALMANEVGLHLNGMSRRCDTVVYARRGLRPLMIVEYKAPHVGITERVFAQVVRYNSVLRTRYIVVSNGLRHYACRLTDAGTYAFLAEMPSYAALED